MRIVVCCEIRLFGRCAYHGSVVQVGDHLVAGTVHLRSRLPLVLEAKAEEVQHFCDLAQLESADGLAFASVPAEVSRGLTLCPLRKLANALQLLALAALEALASAELVVVEPCHGRHTVVWRCVRIGPEHSREARCGTALPHAAPSVQGSHIMLRLPTTRRPKLRALPRQITRIFTLINSFFGKSCLHFVLSRLEVHARGIGT